MGIPIGVTYHVSKDGTVTKRVHCESCGTDFEYDLTRTGHGKATSWLFLNNYGAEADAEGDANEELRERLESEQDPVPCPHCGWYQQDMLPFYRWNFHRWMLGLGVVFLLAGFILLACTASGPTFQTPESIAANARMWTITILVLVAGFGLAIGREVWARVHQPNRIPLETRIQLGRHRAHIVDSQVENSDFWLK